MEQALALRSLIFKEKNEMLLAQNQIDKIVRTLEMKKPVNRKIFKRHLNGSLLEYERIANAKNEKEEYNARVTHLKELIKIHEMGGGEEFPVEKAKKEIEENVARLKVLITVHNQPSY